MQPIETGRPFSPWHVDALDFPAGASAPDRARFLIRYAILAPSSHNTQPWKFAVRGTEIHLYADLTRWLKVADVDRRELYISLGCALENLLLAAERFGLGGRVSYFPLPRNEELVATVSLEPGGETSRFRDPALFRAIPSRRTNHRPYTGRPVELGDQELLRACCGDEEVDLYLTGHSETKEALHGLVVQADAFQFANPAFREELGYWIGQGVFGAPWLLAKLGMLAMTYADLGRATARRDSEALMSAPVFGLLATRRRGREAQVRAGQVFERICLRCAALGLALQPISQLVEVPETRSRLRDLFPLEDALPIQPFRVGHAPPEEAATPRRPLEEVLTLLE
jgi:nitroreductase